MRFTISREKLLEGLQAVASAVPAKTTLPVLANLMVETTDRGIRLSATDLDIAVSTEISADVETAGAITIPARKLSEIVRELPPASVKISASGEQKVTIECGRSKFKLLGLPRDEFPTFPSVRFNDSWRIKSGDLQNLIQHTSFAVSTEESRPILNGVLWELRDDKMRMVATNGHRLAKMKFQSVAVVRRREISSSRPRRSNRSASCSPPKKNSKSRVVTTTSASSRRSRRCTRVSSRDRTRITSR
jgi:DNA polymerase-3 subunit beta